MSWRPTWPTSFRKRIDGVAVDDETHASRGVSAGADGEVLYETREPQAAVHDLETRLAAHVEVGDDIEIVVLRGVQHDGILDNRWTHV